MKRVEPGVGLRPKGKGVTSPLGFALGVVGLILADVVALEGSLLLGFATREVLGRFSRAEVPLGHLASVAWGLLLFPLGYALAGLYPGYGLSPVERMRRKVQVTFFMFLALIAWEWLFLRESWSRSVLLSSWGFALVLPSLAEALVREGLLRLGFWGIPVLILGAGKTGGLVARALQRERALGLNPVGFLDDDPQKWGREMEGLSVLGPLEEAGTWARRGVRAGILAMPGVGRERLRELLETLPFPKVILVPDLLGLQSLWVSSRDLGGVLALELRKNLLLWPNRVIKRLLDYALGVPLFLIALPLIGFFALWIKLVSPGPGFYAQERVGYGGRSFRVWKLRTMYPDAERRLKDILEGNPEAKAEWERYFKLRNDPRVLPGIGHFLRRTSLDELPQLWNVLRGEMSLVGPRPFTAYHLQSFSPSFRALRQGVLPGLTGLWQVSARSEGDLEVQEALDTYYVRNWSLWLDLYILARTVWVVLLRKGAY